MGRWIIGNGPGEAFVCGFRLTSISKLLINACTARNVSRVLVLDAVCCLRPATKPAGALHSYGTAIATTAPTIDTYRPSYQATNRHVQQWGTYCVSHIYTNHDIQHPAHSVTVVILHAEIKSLHVVNRDWDRMHLEKWNEAICKAFAMQCQTYRTSCGYTKQRTTIVRGQTRFTPNASQTKRGRMKRICNAVPNIPNVMRIYETEHNEYRPNPKTERGIHVQGKYLCRSMFSSRKVAEFIRDKSTCMGSFMCE